MRRAGSAYPPNDPGALVTVHAPLLKKEFTYQAFCIYETPATPPDAPRLCLFGPLLKGDYYELLPIQLIAWRRRVYSEKSPLYVEACWHPRRGESIDLKGMRDDPGLKGVVEARRAGKLLQAVEKRGRRSGPAGFTDAQEFEDVLVHLIQIAHGKGLGTKQERIAVLLGPELAKRRGSVGSAASVDVNIESTVRLIRKHSSCLWDDLVRKALQSL